MDKKLEARLLRMVAKDQLMRKKQMSDWDKLVTKYPDPNNPIRVRVIKSNSWAKNLLSVDRLHTNKLKKIIARYGWPGKKLVGREGNQAVWLLAQHADHDLAFQKECLKLLKKSARDGNSEARHVALLTDRVLVKENKKQIYGTQFQRIGNDLQPFPIRDIKKLNERRRKMGLDSFAKYEKLIKNK